MGVRSHEASEPTPGGDTHASVLCTDVGSMKRGWRCIHIALLSRSSRTPTRGQALRCTARNGKPPGGVRNRRRQGTSRCACDVLQSDTVHSVYARACTGCIRKGEACVTKIPRQLGSRCRSHTAYACSVHSNTEVAELVEKAMRNTAPEIRFGTPTRTRTADVGDVTGRKRRSSGATDPLRCQSSAPTSANKRRNGSVESTGESSHASGRACVGSRAIRCRRAIRSRVGDDGQRGALCCKRHGYVRRSSAFEADIQPGSSATKTTSNRVALRRKRHGGQGSTRSQLHSRTCGTATHQTRVPQA